MSSKYTLLVPPDEAVTWDEVALRMRRELGRRVDKSAIVRAAVKAVAEDPELFARVVEVIRNDTDE